MSDKTKKKKILGVTVFMRFFKKQHPQFSSKPMNDMGLIRAAQEAYSQLSPRDREYWEIQAKNENKEHTQKHGKSWQKDTLGDSVKVFEILESDKQYYNDKARNTIISMINAPDILDREFIFADIVCVLHLNEDCEPDATPLELSFVKFSIKSGVKETLCLHPRTLSIPLGQTHSFNEEVIDQMGMKPHEDYTNDRYDEMWKDIRNFCRQAGNQYPPLFVPRKNIEKMIPSIFKFCTIANIACPWVSHPSEWKNITIYSLEELFAALTLKRITEVVTPQDIISSARVSKNYFSSFFGAELACEWHMVEDQALKCGLNILSCYVFSGIRNLQQHYSEYIFLNEDRYLPPCLRSSLLAQENRDRKMVHHIHQDWDEDDWLEHTPTQFSERTPDPVQSVLTDNIRSISLNAIKKPGTSVMEINQTQAWGRGRSRGRITNQGDLERPGAISKSKKRINPVDL